MIQEQAGQCEITAWAYRTQGHFGPSFRVVRSTSPSQIADEMGKDENKQLPVYVWSLRTMF